MESQKNRKRLSDSNYVMFGYCLSDDTKTGYLKAIPKSTVEDYLTDDILLAKKFSKKTNTGSPDTWVEFVNGEIYDLFKESAYKFHLVKTCL